MWTSTSLTIFCGLFLAAAAAAGAPGETLRYRGDYTYGHEANVFCPHTNSQCYWLDGDTPEDVRNSLLLLSSGDAAGGYAPVCILVEGVVDRNTPRSGLAADYDGVIAISALLGTCAESTLTIESDLQHHRWVLESIDGKSVVIADADGLVPDLDFGEQMQVTGNTGCNRISGKAELSGEFFQIPAMASTRRLCSPPQNDLERRLQTVLIGKSRIAIDEEGNLVLTTDGTVLRYYLRDWVK